MNRICSACNILIGINKYKKDRTVCKTCYNKKIRKNNNNTLPPNKINIYYQQRIIENINNKKKLKINNNNVSTYENHAYGVIGPRNVGKTFYMLKVLEKMETKDLFINSPDHPINI